MAKSKEYWQERFTQLEDRLLQKGVSYSSDLERQYRMAISDIEKEISKWYTRLETNNDISLAEARKLLTYKELEEFRWNVFDYIKYGEENAIDGRWMKQLENASARVHISKLEAMKLHLQHYVEVLFGRQLGDIEKLGKDIYTEGYYHIAYEIQRGFNVGWSLFPLDTDRITKVISKPWAADGVNFSTRIWGNKTKLINTLHTQLTQSIIRGDSPDHAISMITREMDVSRYNAGRLVMTESAFFTSAAQQDCFNTLDVEKFEILATLDNRTSEICQDLDGHVTDMTDYEVGVTAPPFHPWCRTTTIPYFDDNYGERIARDHEGEIIYIPSDIKYAEWKEKFIS